jgi:hypothetical protein
MFKFFKKVDESIEKIVWNDSMIHDSHRSLDYGFQAIQYLCTEIQDNLEHLQSTIESIFK